MQLKNNEGCIKQKSELLDENRRRISEIEGKLMRRKETLKRVEKEKDRLEEELVGKEMDLKQ